MLILKTNNFKTAHTKQMVHKTVSFPSEGFVIQFYYEPRLLLLNVNGQLRQTVLRLFFYH